MEFITINLLSCFNASYSILWVAALCNRIRSLRQLNHEQSSCIILIDKVCRTNHSWNVTICDNAFIVNRLKAFILLEYFVIRAIKMWAFFGSQSVEKKDKNGNENGNILSILLSILMFLFSVYSELRDVNKLVSGNYYQIVYQKLFFYVYLLLSCRDLCFFKLQITILKIRFIDGIKLILHHIVILMTHTSLNWGKISLIK